MAQYRQTKINTQIQRELSEIIREIKDYRLSKVLIGITGVSVSKDLSTAKVGYSAIAKNGGQIDEKEIIQGMNNAAGHIRSALASRLNLRITPKLTFILDNSTQSAIHISEVLKDITYSSESENE